MPTRLPSRHRTRRRPTIFDVAERAGVSIGSVSNVLNQRGNVSDQRRARVGDAIAALGYVPNSLAQGLRRSRSRVIGLCAPLASTAYFAALLDAFEDIAARHGYEVMQVLSRQDPDVELRRVQALLARKVDGLILIPSSEPRHTLDAVAASGVPAVIVDRLSDDPRFDYVTVDDYGTMVQAAGALMTMGHRRLLFVVRYPKLVTTRRRIEGLRDAAAAQGDVAVEICVRDPDEAAFGRQVAVALQGRKRPTAIIASNSDLTLAVLRILKQSSIRCPQEISLLAFDDPPWAEVLTPALSVVHPPIEGMARTAWELLECRMRHEPGDPQRLTLHALLVLRESVAPPAS